MDSETSAGISTNQSGAQLTVRALATGMVFGSILSLCNLYVGLKIGWGIGMSLTAALLAFGFWQLLQQTGRYRGLSKLETNISQTAASAAASIAGAGLVAPIPALTILTGQTLSWGMLVIWTFSVCLVGVIVSIGLRKQLIEVDNLPFPSGFATGKTIQELYNHGRDAIIRLKLLGGTAVLASVVTFAAYFKFISKIPIPGWIKAQPGGGLEKAGLSGFSPANFGIAIEPTLMMYGVGAIVGPRIGISVLLGVLVSWGVLAPYVFEVGWAVPGDPDASWFNNGLKWLLWPGVALMVASSLTSFAFSWKSILNAFKPLRKEEAAELSPCSEVIPKKWFMTALVAITALSVILQTAIFGIEPWLATFGVLLTFMLALVAARVSGEVNVTPVTAMGKVTQLTFAVIAPANPTSNLMVANVTGGSAALCADMMHDLKTGKMLGADPRPQYIAQIFGVFAGALVGCAGYLILIPDPANQLFTEQWPAPSVTVWMSVAQLFMDGLEALPSGAVEAMTIGACVGIVLAIGEKTLPGKARNWVPSGPSMGLAFLIAPGISFALFVGSMAALAAEKVFPNWSGRYLVIAASGIIAGESLSGMFLALIEVLKGG
ncbi:MAG: OPT family oligopeptide transporter [Opitutales bacterium]